MMPHDFVSFFVYNIEKLIVWCITILCIITINFSLVSLKGVLLPKEFWNISAKSFKSTREKVKYLKKLCT